MEFLGQRWDYREDKFHEIGTSDQSLMTDGKYRSIDMAVRHHFKQWADGKIIRILVWPSHDTFYKQHKWTYYLNAAGDIVTKQPVPQYELVNDWGVELFHTDFLAWGYKGDRKPMFYEPVVVYWKHDTTIPWVTAFEGKVPDLSDRNLFPVEFWRKPTWGWRMTKPNDFPLNWNVADTLDQCLLDAMAWCNSQSNTGWYYHGHYEPMVHAMQRIKVRTQDSENGTTWTNFDMSKVPAPVAERIARIPKEAV